MIEGGRESYMREQGYVKHVAMDVNRGMWRASWGRSWTRRVSYIS